MKHTFENIPSGGGTPSRIQNSDNTRFVDTQASEVAVDLRPSLSQGGGSESGRIKLARNFFELYAEKIHTNPNFKHKYQIITKDNGGIDIVVTDTELLPPEAPSRNNTYSFDYDGLSNPNQVARVKELQDAVDTIADMLGVL